MMDFFIDSEYGQGEILQISGGEPTLHPDILAIITMAKSKNFKPITRNVKIQEYLNLINNTQVQ